MWDVFTYPCPNFIIWKHFPRYWPFVRGIHRSPVNSPYKGQWRGVLMFSLICVWINGWVNNREAGDLRRYRTHYDVIVMGLTKPPFKLGLGWEITSHLFFVKGAPNISNMGIYLKVTYSYIDTRLYIQNWMDPNIWIYAEHLHRVIL